MDGALIKEDGKPPKRVPGQTLVSKMDTRSPSELNKPKSALATDRVEAIPHYDEGKDHYFLPFNEAGRLKAEELGFSHHPYPDQK